MRSRLTRAARRRALLVAALALAAFAPACEAPMVAPIILGQAVFPEGGGVTSGLEDSSPSTVSIDFIDFVGVEATGGAKMSFRWKPHMGSPYHESLDDTVEEGGTWRMIASVVYYDTVRRHVSLECSVSIVTDGSLQVCTMK